jgi:hypothetical protein
MAVLIYIPTNSSELPFPPHPCQPLSSLIFLIVKQMRCYLTLVLIFIPLTLVILSIFSFTC